MTDAPFFAAKKENQPVLQPRSKTLFGR